MVFINRILASNKRSMFREIFPSQSAVWVRGTMPHPSTVQPYKANALTYAVFGAIALYFAYNIPLVLYYTQGPDPVKSDALKYDRNTKNYVKN